VKQKFTGTGRLIFGKTKDGETLLPHLEHEETSDEKKHECPRPPG
jgi:hypothetical protein